MEVLRNKEEKVMCPYNPAHYILKYRIEGHLTKCRKNYKESANARLVTCDFNACHRIPEPEKQYHHETCPNRKEVELQVYAEEGVLGPVAPRAPVPAIIDTDWDTQDVASYDPIQNCLDRDVLRRLDIESSAKRREFRQSERHRLNNLEPAKVKAAVPGMSKVNPSQPGTSKSSKQTPKSESTPNLPPTPSFSSASIEKTPDDVVEMMNKLALKPKRAVIPKKSNNPQ